MNVPNRDQQEKQAELQSKYWENIKVFADDLRKKLVTSLDVWSSFEERPVLPDGCKYFEKTVGGMLVVIEQKPQVRTIRTKNTYRLAFPYVIFAYTLPKPTQACIYFNTKPLKNIEDQVYEATMLNVEGTSVRKDVDSEIANKFWQTEFNELPNNLLISWSAWQEATKNNPLFVLKAKYVSVGSLAVDLEKLGMGSIPPESLSGICDQAVEKLKIQLQNTRSAYE